VSTFAIWWSAMAWAQPVPEPPASPEPAPAEPAPAEPAPTEPAPAEPAPTEPASTEPAPTSPETGEPAPTTEPAPVDPAPAPVDPAPAPEPLPPAAPAPEDLYADEDVYEVEVEANEVVGGINDSIEQRRDSAVVTEVIGAEQMSKSGDSTATAALTRVTGLTIVDGRFVFVRGLGDRYSSTLLNGSTLPSPEPERRVVPLDLFPTGLLKSVTIQKTWTPDLPGEFGGGTVLLETRGIPKRSFDQLTLTGGWSGGATFRATQTQETGASEFFGFGLADRRLPTPLANATRNAELVEGDLFNDGFTPEQLERIGESIDEQRFATSPATVPPDFGVQAAIGRRIELGVPVFGFYAGLTFNNARSLDTYDQRFLDVGAGGALSVQNDYRFRDYRDDILLGGLLDMGIAFNEQQSVWSTTTLSRSSTAMSRTYQGFNGDLGSDLRSTRLQWVERQLLVEQLRGRHEFPPLAGFRVDWRYAYSSATRVEPDTRDTRYDLEESTGEYLISDRPEGNGVFYSTLGDRNHDARLDLTQPFGTDDHPGRVAVGGQLVFRDREVDTRRFAYFERQPIPGADRDLPPERLFADDRVGPDGWELRETTRATDNYTADQRIRGAYALGEVPFGAAAPGAWGLKDLSVLAGARVEQSVQRVTTFELFNPDQVPVVAELATTDLLPSVTLTQGLLPARAADDPAMQVRAGYARTVSRPDFRELSPAPFNDVTGGREVFGNPDLERATIDHVDLRWELYPRPGETLSLGAFYKRFTDPIETVVIASAQLSTTWQNASGATNTGIELDWRQTFVGVAPVLDRFYVSANGALIRSRIDLQDAGGIQTSTERPLQGQSPWVVNAQLGYDDQERKTIATASFNLIGPRIVEVGAVGAPDVIEQPAPRLDLLVQQGFGRGWYVRLRGRNLLDPSFRITQGDEVVREGREGWQGLLSLEWRDG
jgi:hypothetical protein